MKTHTLPWRDIPIRLAKMEAYLRVNLPAFDGISANVNSLTIISKIDLYQSDIDLIENYYNSLTLQTEANPSIEEQTLMVESAIEENIAFGLKLVIQFSTENVLLGITQRNMTNRVRQVTFQVVNALMTGSLKDAITETRLIPLDHKDDIFITDVRMIKFINKVEDYLGIPRSTSL